MVGHALVAVSSHRAPRGLDARGLVPSRASCLLPGLLVPVHVRRDAVARGVVARGLVRPVRGLVRPVRGL